MSELAEAQLADLEKRWLAIVTGPQRYRWLYKGRWRRALPLPWHTRLRLRLTGWRDGIAIWLACRDHPGAAVAVWRLTGAWRTR